MKKSLLLTTLLAAGITQVQAAPFAQAFTDGSPEKGAVTFTFSGDCSGKITSDVSRIEAGVYDDHANNKFSYIRVYTVDWTNMLLEDILYTQSVGSTTSVSVNKGKLNVKFSDTSALRAALDIQKIHTSGADSQIQCKNGSTLNQLVNDQNGGDFKLIRDTSLTEKTSFTLKGSVDPFDYKLSQKISGYLYISKPTCDITGNSTGHIATDTYKSICKLQPKVKVSISVSASGKTDI
jgi:hypothetical protein